MSTASDVSISVVLPVHNGADTLDASIRSIFQQTIAPLEVIVIDDGSYDATAQILSAWSRKEARLHVIRHTESKGVSVSLNTGIAAAQGAFVARMDADDTAVKHRFQSQLSVFNEDPDVAVVGSWIKVHPQRGRPFTATYPIDPDAIRSYLLFDNPLAHPAVMMRRSLFSEEGYRYDESLPASQDMQLWFEVVKHHPIRNVAAPLLHYTVHQHAVTSRKKTMSDAVKIEIQRQGLQALGITLDSAGQVLHMAAGHGVGVSSPEALNNVREWLERIRDANTEKQLYVSEGLDSAIAMVWYRVCLNSLVSGRWAASMYRDAPWSYAYTPIMAERAAWLKRRLLPAVHTDQPIGERAV